MRPLRSLKAVWDNDWTKLWVKVQSRAGLLSGSILATVSSVNGWVSDPTFKSYLDMIDPPKTLIIAIAVIGLVAWLSEGKE